MEYWVGVGSNLGDGVRQAEQALAELGAHGDIEIRRRSSLYRTAPWGDRSQPSFTNAVVILESGLSPYDMLDVLQHTERRMGRIRGERRWGPREIDLDLLLADDLIIHRPRLVIPHPRMHRRAFVLTPMAELAPDLEIPGRGRVAYLLRGLSQEGIERLG